MASKTSVTCNENRVFKVEDVLMKEEFNLETLEASSEDQTISILQLSVEKKNFTQELLFFKRNGRRSFFHKTWVFIRIISG